MDLMQIKGFHRINGESRMPSITEDLKFTRWNNTLGCFEYVIVEDLHLVNVIQSGPTVTLVLNDNTTFQFNVPNPDDLVLPGDKQILFDNNDAIGGSESLKYDYNTGRIILTDFAGIFAKDSLMDLTHQSILQYIGSNNIFLNTGTQKSVGTLEIYDNIAIGKEALESLTGGDKNIAIGAYAGSQIGLASNNNIFIGSYAGKLEPDSNKLYISIYDSNDLEESRENALLYGEFELNRLHVGKRLNVREEIKIGTFDIANTPESGMIQFVEATIDTVKPQYFDGVEWIDFESSTDVYLENIIQAGTIYTFVMHGADDLVVNIPDTFYPSYGDQYTIQLSNGDDSFISTPNLSWNLLEYLYVDGAIRLTPKVLADYTPVQGLIVSTSAHVYAYLNGSYRQLDNEPTAGQVNNGENLGAGIPVYSGMNIVNHNLQFNTLTYDGKIVINDAVDGELLFELDYVVSGDSAGATGVPIYIDTTHASNASTLNFKKLHSSDSTVVFTEYSTYIDMSVTGGPAAGEANAGENIGTGTEIYKGKNGLLLQLRTLHSDSLDITLGGTDNNEIHISLPNYVDNIIPDVDAPGVGLIKSYTVNELNNVTYVMRNIVGINGISAAVDIDGAIAISIAEDLPILSLQGIQLPVSTNSNKTLTWSISLDENILDEIAAKSEPIVQLNLGSNLTYNPVTNTLNSVGGSGSNLQSVINTSIERLEDGTVDRINSSRNVTFTLSNGSIVYWDGELSTSSGLGWLAFENDYPVASDTVKGIVQVNTSSILSINDGILSAEALDIYIGDTLVYENITTLRFETGSLINIIQGVGENSVKFNVSPYYPPYVHIPDAIIGFYNKLYSYDISEGTAIQLINAPSASYNNNTSFGLGNHIYTTNGNVLYRYSIDTDSTLSVTLGNTPILYLVRATDGIYAISSNSCYHIDYDTFAATYYGNSIASADCRGAIETKDGVTGKNYILLYNDFDSRFYYKEIKDTYSGADSDSFTMSIKFLKSTLFSNTLVSRLVSQNIDADNNDLGYTEKFMLITVDHQSAVFYDIHDLIGNTDSNVTWGDITSTYGKIVHPYLLPSGKGSSGWDNSQDGILTKEVTSYILNSPSYAIVLATSYVNNQLDCGVYVSSTSDIYESLTFEIAVNTNVLDIHISHVSITPLDWDSYVIVGGYRVNNGETIGTVSFKTIGVDKKSFLTKDVLELTNDKKHATIVNTGISFVYFDPTYTANLNPVDINITQGVDLYINGELKEQYIEKLDLVEAGSTTITYDGNGVVIISSTGGGAPASGIVPEFMYEFCIVPSDIETFPLDIYVISNRTINGVITESDGTLTGLHVAIDGIDIAGIDDFTASPITTMTMVTEPNVASVGSRITFHTSGNYTDTPTFVRLKLLVTDAPSGGGD